MTLLLVLQLAWADTLKIRTVAQPPRPDATIDSAFLGSPQIRIQTRRGTASIWLLRAADTVFVAASIPDSTPYWGDDFVLGLDTRGDGGANPQHDDFQWYFRRVLDSSVVFRGRNGRWEPPRDDPDWRLGAERAGGGWEVSGRTGVSGWSLILRLDPAWFTGEDGRRPRLALRIYDNAPSGRFAWPPPQGQAPATVVERTPALWSVVR
ncbi:MAG TPA: hypothetical protein VGJ36_02315 [Gemmatimonadales bacterium]